MPRPLRPHQKAQPPAFFGGQLQPAEDAAVEPFGPGQGGGHARAAERLVQGPKVVGHTGRLNHDQAFQTNPQPGGGRGIELPSLIEHDQGPAFPASLPGRRKGQAMRAAALARHQPFDKRPPKKPSAWQESVKGIAPRGDCDLPRRPASPFPTGNLDRKSVV